MSAGSVAFQIRHARPDDIDVVRGLIVESMGHWARGEEHLAESARLMSLTAGDLARDDAFVLTVGEEVAGYCRVSVANGVGEIEELHVRPKWIGQGFGRALFERCVQRVRERSAEALRWATDSYAAGFYERMGGRPIGSCPSGIQGDEPLTVMELHLG